MATRTTAETVALFRSNHRIVVVESNDPEKGRIYRCAIEDLRVHPMRDGRWRHDSDEIVALLEDNYGGPWGSPKAGVR